MEFVDWPTLATYAGAFTMVLIITQFTKKLRFIKKIPTQIWSYVVALIVLYPAYFFTEQLTASNAVLILFNAIIIAFATNGGYEAFKKFIPKQSKEE